MEAVVIAVLLAAAVGAIVLTSVLWRRREAQRRLESEEMRALDERISDRIAELMGRRRRPERPAAIEPGSAAAITPLAIDAGRSLPQGPAATTPGSAAVIEPSTIGEGSLGPAAPLVTEAQEPDEPVAVARPKPVPVAAAEPVAVTAAEPVPVAAAEPIAVAAAEPRPGTAAEPVAVAASAAVARPRVTRARRPRVAGGTRGAVGSRVVRNTVAALALVGVIALLVVAGSQLLASHPSTGGGTPSPTSFTALVPTPTSAPTDTPTPTAIPESPSPSATRPGPTPTPRPTPLVYIVRPGDTMWMIAAAFGVPVAELIAANPQISNPNLIYAGNRIIIPTPSPSPTASPAP